MALKKEFFSEDYGVFVDYVAVKEVRFENDIAYVHVGIWSGQTNKREGKIPFLAKTYEVPVVSELNREPREWAYTQLKKLPEFDGAVDILEA